MIREFDIRSPLRHYSGPFLWRTESRAKASTHFARAARRVLRVAVFASITFDLMLRHRVLTADYSFNRYQTCDWFYQIGQT